MRTVRRLLYRDIVGSVMFVVLAFLSLFFFIDFVDEMDRVGRKGFTAGHAAYLAVLELPGHFYELFPIAVLIGSIFSLARLAQSSEYTILRTGGLGPGRALGLLATLALGFAALTFVVGDYVAPLFDQHAELTRADFSGGIAPGRSGAWLKDSRNTPQGERNYSVNVGRAGANGQLDGVRIFEFDADGRLLSRTEAKQAKVDARGLWTLSDVKETRWFPSQGLASADNARVTDTALATSQWQSSLNAGVVAAAVLPAWVMSTAELYRYTRHLSAHEQSAQQHEIQFWRKALYPAACIVMVALALPFAYLNARGGGISLKVFGGIMLGISFVLMNNVAGHLGLLQNWTPWAVAATPSLIYLLLSLGAFAWLVRYR
nr:LPS export ABC transporter permease LptG [uncultured Roseateles sp.]